MDTPKGGVSKKFGSSEVRKSFRRGAEDISTDEGAVVGDIDEARYAQYAVGYSSAISAADSPVTFVIVSSGSPKDFIVFAFFLFSSRAPWASPCSMPSCRPC